MQEREEQSDEAVSTDKVGNEAAALQQMIALLSPMSSDVRRRILDTLSTFFGLTGLRTDSLLPAAPQSVSRRPINASFQFSEADPPSLKQFLLEKAPATDVERVACLAYYLTHHRGTPHFKTKDINELNTEAAQRRFSNPGFAVDNATKTGYLVPSVKGSKQMSAAGERFVAALPDRVAAREEMGRDRPKRGSTMGKRSQFGTDKE